MSETTITYAAFMAATEQLVSKHMGGAWNRIDRLERELSAALRRAEEAEAIANLAMSEGLDFSLKYVWLRTPRPLDEWHEDNGPALWWTLPVSEPPYAGTPLDDDFPEHVTHWTPLEIPFGGERSDYCPGPSAAFPLHPVIATDAGGSDA